MFGMRLCNGLALEFTYFGLSRSAVAVAEKPDATSYLIFPDNFAGNVFVNMDRAQTDYSSYVNSFELNFPCCCGCCTSAIAVESEPAASAACGQAACGPVGCSSVEWFAGVRYIDIANG